ncbi:MAG: CinA family protein [Campylobacterota bacterium]|nr:CinA family protein [Campylobacterota bacterium]
MKLHIIFIGNKFVYNTSLRDYVLRKIEEKTDFIDSVIYFKEGDNSIFLSLEEQLNSYDNIIVVTSKQNFSTIGKLICTATSDNQILQDGMLLPQKCSLFEEKSYLLEYKNSITNVMQIDEGEKMPALLLQNETSRVTIHVFEESRETIKAILNPIAQTYDVLINVVEEVVGWLRIDISSNRYGDVTNFVNSAKQLLSKQLIARENISEYIIERLSQNQKRITFAESCTGGLLSYYFTKSNGASKILDGSLVTYSNSLKENWLAVEHNIIEDNGAVSTEVVREMSSGALDVSGADYAISISGVAGDTGGTEEKPVGTIYIGVRSRDAHSQERLSFSGDRNYIQHQSVLYAVKMLLLLDKEMFF